MAQILSLKNTTFSMPRYVTTTQGLPLPCGPSHAMLAWYILMDIIRFDTRFRLCDWRSYPGKELPDLLLPIVVPSRTVVTTFTTCLLFSFMDTKL